MARYKLLAEQIVNDIHSGRLAEGMKLPSLRQLSRQHAVSMSTAVSCYQELESQGWIAAWPQSGFFVSVARNKFRTPIWSQFVSEVTRPTVPGLHSGFSGPLGMSGMELDDKARLELEKCFRRTLKKVTTELERYPDPAGEAPLRSALAEHFGQYHFPFAASELVITHGCISAVKNALETCTRAGDTVAVSSPCFSGLLALLEQIQRNIIEIPSVDQGVDLDQFEAHLQRGTVQAALFCTTHMNPQGMTMSVEQKKRLAALAEQYQVPVIEDDVYIELSHGGDFSLPTKYFDKAGYIIWCGSFSKSLSPAYRLGWCLPGRYLKAYQQVAAKGCLGVSTLLQHGLTEFIRSGQYLSYLKRKRIELLQNLSDYTDYLARHLPRHARVSMPRGGLVLWIQVPGLNGDMLRSSAVAQQLDIRPGEVFTSLPLYRDCVRINIGHKLDDSVRQELDKLIRIIIHHQE